MKPIKLDAVRSLVDGALLQTGDGEIVYNDGQTPPSDSAIDSKLASLISDWEATQYQRSRASEYPSITDVVVALAEKEEGDSTMWDDITAKRQAVKTKYKKG